MVHLKPAKQRVKSAGSGRVYRRLSYLATVLALVVVVLGAYVRLTDAGLGCPDWPGCYGHNAVAALLLLAVLALNHHLNHPLTPAMGQAPKGVCT